MNAPTSLGGARSRRLLPFSALLISAAGLASAIFVLFPDEHRLFDIARRDTRDALSIAYLRALLRTHPDHRAIRYSLAHDLAATGDWTGARGALAPLTSLPGKAGLDARLALLGIEQSSLRQKPASDPERRAITADIAQQIVGTMSQPTPSIPLDVLLEAARDIARPDLVALILDRLANTNAPTRERWLALAARHWLANGAPLKAAFAYGRLAMLPNPTLATRRSYALLALDTFVAADNGKAALTFGRSVLTYFGTDAGFLERLVVIAQAQNDIPSAQQFGRQLLALSPNAVPLLERQIDIELAARALPDALTLATRLVTLAPDARHRSHLAEIAEWNSAQEVALAQWTVLAQGDPAGAPMARALSLARGRSADRLWLELLAKATRTRALAPDEQATMLAIAQQQPDAALVADFLEGYVGRHAASLDLWLALSDAHAASGDLVAAASTIRRIPAAQLGPVEMARREALLLDRGTTSEAALVRLREVRNQAAASDSAYWILLGDLAWKHQRRTEAVQAYRAGWNGGATQVPVAERLIEAANDSGNYTDAIAVAREAYRRFKDPRWLLLGMDSSSRGARWDDLRGFLELANSKPEQFKRSDMYWLLSAHLAQHDGRNAAARSAFHHALQLKPDSVPIRVALLWFEVDSGDRAALSKLLREYDSDAPSDPAYWGPFAAGLVRLQRNQEALPWFERQIRAKPEDTAWKLEYAEALARAGRKDDARHVRHDTYAQLRAQLQTAGHSAASLPKPLMLSYADLVRQFEGEPAAQALLLQMAERGHDSADVRERLVDVLLSQRNYDAARDWLQRSGTGHDGLPARQYLALAEADNDHAEIARILASDNASLSTPDRISALRKLGRNTEALQLADRAATDPEFSDNPWLRDMTTQLRWQQGKRGGFLAEQRQIGGLDLRKLEAYAGLPIGDARLTVRGGRTTLGGSVADFVAADRSEDDLSAAVELPIASGDARITLGANHRRDDSLAYGRVEWTRQFDRRFSLHMDAYANMVSEESALLRAIGKKDKLAATVTAALNDASYARLEVGAQRYQTRGGERLGSGDRIQAELGTTMTGHDLRWQTRLSASWERNALAAQVPAGPRSGGLPFSASIADVVPAKFGWAGVGSTLFFGDASPVPGRWHGFIDGVLGAQWPEHRMGYGVRATLALPLAKVDELRIEGFHSNVQNGVGAAAVRGVRVSYEHQF